MFLKIDRISCCFVKASRYCFSVGNFYCTARKFVFCWCVPTTYFALFKSLFCWNHLPSKILFEWELKSQQINFVFWTICRWAKAFFYWLNITKNWPNKWKESGVKKGLESMEHLGFIFFPSPKFLKATH